MRACVCVCARVCGVTDEYVAVRFYNNIAALIACPQDQVEVEVVRLMGIRIRAPITRMKTKAQVGSVCRKATF